MDKFFYRPSVILHSTFLYYGLYFAVEFCVFVNRVNTVPVALISTKEHNKSILFTCFSFCAAEHLLMMALQSITMSVLLANEALIYVFLNDTVVFFL